MYERKKGWKALRVAGGDTPRPLVGFVQNIVPIHSVMVCGTSRLTTFDPLDLEKTLSVKYNCSKQDHLTFIKSDNMSGWCTTAFTLFKASQLVSAI